MCCFINVNTLLIEQWEAIHQVEMKKSFIYMYIVFGDVALIILFDFSFAHGLHMQFVIDKLLFVIDIFYFNYINEKKKNSSVIYYIYKIIIKFFWLIQIGLESLNDRVFFKFHCFKTNFKSNIKFILILKTLINKLNYLL